MGRDNPPAHDSARRWYWAVATYKAVRSGAARRRHLWQRIAFLVEAPAATSATELAKKTALEKQHENRSATGRTARWEFQSLEEVQALFDDTPRIGTEVYWDFFERVDGAGSANTRRINPDSDNERPPRTRDEG